MTYPLLDAFLTMLWFFLFILWIFLLIRVFTDIFRSTDLSGWGKAGWSVFVIILPLVGVLAYLIARGGTMSDREVRQAQAQEEQFRSYVRQVAHENGEGADELTKLADLRDRGVISEADFERGKERVLSRMGR